MFVLISSKFSLKYTHRYTQRETKDLILSLAELIISRNKKKPDKHFRTEEKLQIKFPL